MTDYPCTCVSMYGVRAWVFISGPWGCSFPCIHVHLSTLIDAPVLGGEKTRLDGLEVLLHSLQHAVHRRVEVEVAARADRRRMWLGVIVCGLRMRQEFAHIQPSQPSTPCHGIFPTTPRQPNPSPTHLVILPTGPESLMGGRCSGEGSTLIRSKIFCVFPSPRSSVWATCVCVLVFVLN